MFGLSIWHIVILLLIGFLLFGGKLSDLMGLAGRKPRNDESIAPMIADRFMPPLLQRILRALFR